MTWLIFSTAALLLYLGLLFMVAVLSSGILLGLYLCFEELLKKFLSATSLTSWSAGWRGWISGHKDDNGARNRKS
jgi:hypothetical protein